MSAPISRQHSLKYSTSVKSSSREVHMGTLPGAAAGSAAPSSPQQQLKREDETSGSTENEDSEIQEDDACGPLYASTTVPVNTVRHLFPETSKEKISEEEDPLEMPEMYEQMLPPKKSIPPDPVYGNVTTTTKGPSKAPDFYVNYPKRS